MHPRTARTVWTPARAAQAAAVLEFIRARGAVNPREVDEHFAHGKVTNWFGGSSNASTELLDVMHYRGLQRVARREGGTRVYAARETAAGPDTVAPPLDADAVRRKQHAVQAFASQIEPDITTGSGPVLQPAMIERAGRPSR